MNPLAPLSAGELVLDPSTLRGTAPRPVSNSECRASRSHGRSPRQPVPNFALHASRSRGRSPRRGVILLLVVSLLALFILLGVTFTIVALQALNASKLEIKVQQVGDQPETEMDLVLGQLLYDTQARTVLQYHSLLRDLYGFDGADPISETDYEKTLANYENAVAQVSYNAAQQPQFRESFKGTVIPTDVLPQGVTTPASTVAGNQLQVFLFALPPFSFSYPITAPYTITSSDLPTDATYSISNQARWQSLTALSIIPNYYVGRVITFTSGPAANLSARIVAYSPITDYSKHQPVATSQRLNNNTTVEKAYLPAYGMFAIEALQSSSGSTIAPALGDSFIVNGAPFNGAGAGYDPLTGNLDAVVTRKDLITAAIGGSASVATAAQTIYQTPLAEYTALLPNYASYDKASRATVFDPQNRFTTHVLSGGNPAPGLDWVDPIHRIGNKARNHNAVAIGGMDESWDAPDFQNMFLAMVPPRVAERRLDNVPGTPSTYANDLPIIPSFHRPELINYWFNWVVQNIFLPSTLNHNITAQDQQAYVFLFPYGPDGQPGTSDDPINYGSPNALTLPELERIHAISRGCMFRPLPGDHPNFSGSNSSIVGSTKEEKALSLLSILLGNHPDPTTGIVNQNHFDVDNDNDGVPDSVWIDPGLPIITMPDGRRVKRLAAILVKDLDGLINVNAHGNLAQVHNYNSDGTTTFPYDARYGMLPSMISNTYQSPRAPVDPQNGNRLYYHSVGLALGQVNAMGDPLPGQLLPRGIGFGPAEVNFAGIFGTNAASFSAYQNLMSTRYVSNRVNSAGILDSLTSIDNTVKFTGLPFATPGIPYYRDGLSVVKHSGVPNDYGNSLGLADVDWAQQPSWFGSPPDVWGRGAVVLDPGGQPLMSMFGGGRQPIAATAPGGYTIYKDINNLPVDELVDSPYEMLLNAESDGTDSPYTAAELERLLRYHDGDSKELPARLLASARAFLAPGYPAHSGPVQLDVNEPPGTIGSSQRRRSMLSSISSHLPVPAARLPQEMRVNDAIYGTYMPAGLNTTGAVGHTSILDLYSAKLQRGGITNAQVLEDEMQKIVPWEFFKGQKFDINRWLGDGADNNSSGTIGYGVTDDQSDVFQTLAIKEHAFRDNDVDNDGTVDIPDFELPASFRHKAPAHTNGLGMSDSFAAKQAYARHLFCLAMLFLPDDPGDPAEFMVPDFAYDEDIRSATGATRRNYNRKLLVRRIAQWAINCVDFRDTDSAMTPFEFDYNPWNGWNVDGYVGRSPGRDGGWGRKGVDDNGNGIIDEPAEFNSGMGLAEEYRDIEIDGANWDDVNSERGLVWGMEAPDLLITETLAFHDRGLKDTKRDNGTQKFQDPAKDPSQMAPHDPDLDQFRIPKGSLFVELYSPRATQWPGESSSFKPPVGALDLSARAPVAFSGGVQRPIWRLAFAKLKKDELDPLNPTHLPTRAITRPASVTVDPLVYDPSDSMDIKWRANLSQLHTNAELEINRFAYFTNSSYVPPEEEPMSFFFSAGATTIFPGQYAVVAPRTVTYLGSKNPTGANPPPPASSLWGGNADQFIQVGSNLIFTQDTAGVATSRNPGPSGNRDMRAPVGIICDRPGPTGAGMTWNIGLNISEPMPAYGYYPIPSVTPSDTSTRDLSDAGPVPRATEADFYADPDTSSGTFRDEPIEKENATTVNNDRWPIVENQMQHTGTYPDCSSVLLQRLADATLPYNPPFNSNDPLFDPSSPTDRVHNPNWPVNPYITVDWSAIDLTVFNGEEDVTNTLYNTEIGTTSNLAFRSRQRGFLTPGGGLTSNPWPPITETPVGTDWGTNATTTATYFRVDLSNNLLDPSQEIPEDTSVDPPLPRVPPYGRYPYVYDPENQRHSLGSLNGTVDFPMNSSTTPTYFGEPILPFPWLTWNRRPFANAMELLLVPSSAPDRLALEMTPDFPVLPGQTVTITTPTSPYNDYTSGTPNPASWHWPFGHMLNLFHDAPIDTSAATATSAPWLPTFPNVSATSRNAPHFYRLLDYVEAPSPFIGAERWYNPESFLGVSIYQPPFNKLSRFRDPGRININTIFDGDIWDALVGNFPGLRAQDGFAQQLSLSRQGYGSTAAEVLAMNASYPSRFSNPFRAADSADLMPPGTLRKATAVTATLLRPDPTVNSTSTPIKPQPLFQINYDPATGGFQNSAIGQWSTSPGQVPSRNLSPGSPGIAAHAHDINRNPYFRYQPLQKIGNIVSTNSNCFAIWITIGYFELEEHKQTTGAMATIYDAAHPDGYALGQEIGYDAGDVKRHRGFYIVDRSIPVGFSPGSKLNTDECILLRRLIE